MLGVITKMLTELVGIIFGISLMMTENMRASLRHSDKVMATPLNFSKRSRSHAEL